MFTWKKIYRELAEKLLQYRDRQDELLSLSMEMLENGLRVIEFKDKNEAGESIPLLEIDPFTFFAHFNRGLTEKNRIKILSFLKTRLKLAAPVPSDFHGIPVANLQKAWFFAFAAKRKEEDIPALWDLAHECLDHGPEKMDAEVFKRCLAIRQIAIPKLTIGLFWLNPDEYIALDSLMVAFLGEKGIKVNPNRVVTISDYRSIIQRVKNEFSDNFPQVSRDAFIGSNKIPANQEEVDKGLRKLLQETADYNKLNINQVVQYILTGERSKSENEITNRIKYLSETKDILNSKPINLQMLQKTLSNLWMLETQGDSIRMNDFFNSGHALNLIEELFNDESDIIEIDRLELFIQNAMKAGYTDPKGKDVSSAVQFASILMSAKFPDRYVDFRENRWNKLFELVTGSNRRLLSGPSYPAKLAMAGKFASSLANSSAFIEFFGNDNALWKVAGLAWEFKNGIPEIVKKINENGAKKDDPPPPSIPRNIILYGPPGTGKTWKLRNDYMVRFTDTEAKLSREEYTDSLVADMGWWQVITMVMMDLKKCKVSQIMVHPLMQARIKRSNNANPRAAIWAHIQMHTKNDCPNVNYKKRYEPLLFWKDEHSTWSIDEEIAAETLPELKNKLKEYLEYDPNKQRMVKRYAFTTFHQSFSYEDFVEGIKPVMASEGIIEDVADDLTYEVRPGIFKTMVQKALADPGHDYALIIDEINRGNVANIFGELITLIEDDKRKDAKNELTAILPYSQTKFVVPKNLYIIGAMNTADRSIEALDTALRRRFTFISVPPDPSLLRNDGDIKGFSVNLEMLLHTINSRIEKLLDKDHCIGHSYFLSILESAEPLQELRTVFATKVLPLLEEYFYGNTAKIGMILGERFVTRNHLDVRWASGDWGFDEFEERVLYVLNNPMIMNEEDFKSIYA
ncbi:AAA family ATPase [Desulfonatronum thioautotrophicum]|uniref:AAA family ATPase n=1 Tax=Desulfonatronum thioautotrophicum TaxID=617001 RepID=UPI0006994E9D|nr:AAA family ATPase [Desulfonatronum thioautotrophicum]